MANATAKETSRYTLALPSDLWQWVTRQHAQTGETNQDVIMGALRNWLEAPVPVDASGPGVYTRATCIRFDPAFRSELEAAAEAAGVTLAAVIRTALRQATGE